MRVIFMGTPEFAVASLKILVDNGIVVVAVITAPDKPQGRGKVLQGSPVKEYAISVSLPVLQPTNLKADDFLQELKSYQADLQIVVAFRMLPELVWNMPPMGTFNLHASLLPQYRGAAPINWAIINGEKETGATTFFLQHEIDTGDIIDQFKEPIYEEDNVGDLYSRLMNRGAELVLSTVKKIQNQDIQTSLQIFSDELKSAPKIHKSTCEINWNQPSERLRNFVRGLSPYPAAWTTWNQKGFKIFETSISDRDLDKNAAIGTFQSDGKTYLAVKTLDGYLEIDELQMEGKKRMETIELLKGYKF